MVNQKRLLALKLLKVITTVCRVVAKIIIQIITMAGHVRHVREDTCWK